MDNSIIYIDTKNCDTGKNEDRVKSKVFKFVNSKKFKIFILIFIAIIAFVLLFGSGNLKQETIKTQTTSTYKYLTTLDYCAELERKLESLLSSIDGAGNVSVMVTVDGSPEIVYANDKDEMISSNSSGTTSSSNSSSPIIVEVNGTDSALILTEKLPEVKGVIVVSSGAKNVAVKIGILEAVSTLLNIDSNKVSVLKGI